MSMNDRVRCFYFNNFIGPNYPVFYVKKVLGQTRTGDIAVHGRFLNP